MKKYFNNPIKFLPLAIVIVFIALEILSRSAAIIFNHVAAEQKMFNGTVTVEKISANFLGNVTFENFLWKDVNGNTLLKIPEGNFSVKILDVVTRNLNSASVENLYFKDAIISIHLAENMQPDVVRNSPEIKNSDREKKSEEELKKIGEERRRLHRERIEKGWKNFNIDGRKIKLNLKLENCEIEIFYRNRHYLFSGVNFETKIDTDDKMTLKVRTGLFGGTMIGRGMKLNGEIDFKNNIPQCNLSILLQEVDPSSLGFGLNIHDEMTLSAHFSGYISKPVGTGILNMKELHIPGLDFKNVEGNIFYEDSMLKFEDVSADVYGGHLSAHGDYNFDTRYYNIHGHGEKLKTYYALPKSHLHCDVDLEMEISSKGNARETVTGGKFFSSKGRYSVLKINSISGKFHTEYNSINFYDVVVDIWNYKIATDALSIVDKKLNLNPIKITDENGNLLMTYSR